MARILACEPARKYGDGTEDAALPGRKTGTQYVRKGWQYKSVRQKRTEKRTGLKTRHYRRQKKKEGGLPFGLLRAKSPALTQQFERDALTGQAGVTKKADPSLRSG